MIKREEGFTLVELMITMLVFALAMVAASNIFSALLNQFKQQSKIAETNIEGLIGLDMMRIDVQQAGFGIPWNLETDGDNDGDDNWSTLGANYNERVTNAGGNADPLDAIYYNDGTTASSIPAPAQQRAPRGILAENLPQAGAGLMLMGTGANTWRSDYLVVKSTSISIGDAAQKWTHITNNGATNLDPRFWNDPNEDLDDNDDRVIVERPALGPSGSQQRVLITDTSVAPPTFSVLFEDDKDDFDTAFLPALDVFETHLIYGVSPKPPTNPAEPLRAPFNRADFYVSDGGTVPSQCAPNTGILYKAVMNHGDGAATEYPLLDCVADMQVVFITETSTPPDDIHEWNNADFPFTSVLTADQIRAQIRGVVVYILAHEGQMDRSFTFTNFSAGCTGVANCMRVGGFDNLGNLMGREFDLSWIDAADFDNYRWKVYTIAVQLINLR